MGRRGRTGGPSVVTRFAPAPTGYLHLGHIVNAIYVWGVRARAPTAASCCGSKITIGSAAGPISRPRSSKIWRGSGSSPTTPLVRQSERGRGLRSRARKPARAGAGLRVRLFARADLQTPSLSRDLPRQGIAGDRTGRGLRVRLDPTVERFDDWRHGPQEQRPSEQCGDLLVRDREGNWTYQFAAAVDDWRAGSDARRPGRRSAGFNRAPDSARPPARPRVNRRPSSIIR